MTNFSILDTAWVFAIVANGGAVLRLSLISLNRKYRALFAYLLFQFLKSVFSFFCNRKSNLYFWTYVGAAPVLWIFYVLIVRELYSNIFQQYRGIYTVSRWMIASAGLLSLLITCAVSYATWQPARPLRTKLFYIEFTEREVVFSLALFVLLLLVFFSRYPVKLPRNLVVHAFDFSVLFLADAALLLLYSLAPGRSFFAADLALEILSAFCYLGWCVLMTRQGEAETVQVTRRVSPESEERLLEQLNAINATLLHALRK